MIKIRKVFNSNIVSAIDEHGKEIVIIGKGIGFGKNCDDIADEKKIQKIFYCAGNPQESRMLKLLKDIPIEYILMTDRVVEYAKEVLNRSLSPSLLITLSDHIHYAVQRAKNNVSLEAPMGEEIRYIYPKEYEISKKAIRYFERKMNVKLHKEELFFFTVHLVNAQKEYNDMSDAKKLSKIMKEIVDIIKDELNFSLDEKSITYCRFIAHLRYFVIRRLNGTEEKKDDVTELYEIAKNKYPKASHCVNTINNYLYKNYNIKYNENEAFYLVMHIERLIMQIRGE